MKKGMRERVSGDDVCDCSFGELLDNKKPFRPFYIFKHMLKTNFVCSYESVGVPQVKSVRVKAQ
jgi:hypothetical protein